jgi:protein-disulfide isomerase/uncharacterized membrane protein
MKRTLKWGLVQAASLACAVAAAFICDLLLVKHMTGRSGVSWFEAGCSAQAGEGRANCAAVLNSPYGYFPPKRPDEPPGKVHVPVAFLGLIYYAVLAVWLLGVGRPSYALRRLHVFPLLFVTAGLSGSVYYSYIMFTALDEWCPWCLTTHVLNLLIAVSLLGMWPRKKDAEAPDSTRPRPLPTFRTVLVSLVGMMLAAYAVYGRAGVMKLPRLEFELAEYRAEVERFRADARALLASWQSGNQYELPDGAAERARVMNPADSGWDLVIFSDFECPVCAATAKFLEERVQPLFDRRLRTIYRHFPLNKECNPRVDLRRHLHACDAAAMAEAAFRLGGPEAFWRAHDALFAHQAALAKGEFKPEVLAERLGLDGPAFREATSSPEAIQRIREDINLAAGWGVTGTPAVFVDGRRVSKLAVREEPFWDALADLFWSEAAKEPRPEHTQRRNLALRQ